jgi:hypothetical protein
MQIDIETPQAEKKFHSKVRPWLPVSGPLRPFASISSWNFVLHLESWPCDRRILVKNKDLDSTAFACAIHVIKDGDFNLKELNKLFNIGYQCRHQL